MQKARALALVSLFVACISPAQSQGLMEGTFVRGLGAGMGAGTAASLSKGKTVRNTYEQMLQAQQAMLAQTKAIEQYVATGAQLQVKKQWANAEQYFQSALQLIAKRDGPGSPKSVPVLEKLAKVSKEQNKLDQAIGYQKTVVAFANRGAQQNPAAAVQAQADLSSMYMDKGDFSNAEGVLKQSTEIVRRDKSINPKTYSSTLKVYGVVLRKLNKMAEADLIEAELAQQSGEAAATTAASASASTAASTSTSASASASTSATEQHVTAAPAVVPAATTSTAGTTTAATSVTATTPAATPAATPAPDAASTAAESKAETSSSASAAASTSDSATSSSAASPSAAVSESATAAPAANAAPPVLLPPPTADWPVMGEDGKIVSEPSVPQAKSSQPAPASSAPAPASSEPAPTSSAPTSASPAGEAAPSTSSPTTSASPAEAADSGKSEGKQGSAE